MKRPELLAPAGDYDCFLAAVDAGADAVYLAGDRFGARAYAGNFTEKDLIKAIDHAHLLGVKVYLTVNTLIKQKEIDKVVPFIEPLYKEGLDGVIIQDLGVASIIKAHFPKLAMSASTQMTIDDIKSANLMADYGFSRVIPARELDLNEIKSLVVASKAEIEVFIHGAMCYSYSGQCLFSSVLGERSANRGRCAAPCRMEYSYEGEKKKYLLSLKDMNTIDYIPKLCDAGVASFKIEGRMKPAEYVYTVTLVYRKYIDLYVNGKDYRIEDEDRALLNSVYIRSNPGCGYLEGKKGEGMITLNSPAYSSDKVPKLKERKRKKIPVDMTLFLRAGENAMLTVAVGDKFVCIKGEVVESAKSAPLSRERIETALRKAGEAPYKILNVDINIYGEVFLPISEINAIRRKGLEEISEALICEHKR